MLVIVWICNDYFLFLAEKDRIFSDHITASPITTPKHSKNSSPDRIMQSIAAIDTQLEVWNACCYDWDYISVSCSVARQKNAF